MRKPWYLASILLALLVGFASGYGIDHQRWMVSLPSLTRYQLNLLSSLQARVVMMGDSITQQGDWSKLQGKSSRTGA